LVRFTDWYLRSAAWCLPVLTRCRRVLHLVSADSKVGVCRTDPKVVSDESAIAAITPRFSRAKHMEFFKRSRFDYTFLRFALGTAPGAARGNAIMIRNHDEFQRDDWLVCQQLRGCFVCFVSRVLFRVLRFVYFVSRVSFRVFRFVCFVSCVSFRVFRFACFVSRGSFRVFRFVFRRALRFVSVPQSVSRSAPAPVPFRVHPMVTAGPCHVPEGVETCFRWVVPLEEFSRFASCDKKTNRETRNASKNSIGSSSFCGKCYRGRRTALFPSSTRTFVVSPPQRRRPRAAESASTFGSPVTRPNCRPDFM
jgi:hypothetical protein